jgi:hypothetical protein
MLGERISLDQLSIAIRQNIAHPPDTWATRQLVPNEPDEFGEFFEGRGYSGAARQGQQGGQDSRDEMEEDQGDGGAVDDELSDELDWNGEDLDDGDNLMEEVDGGDE